MPSVVKELLISELLDLSQTDHAAIFEGCQYPWEALPKLTEYLKKNLKSQILGKVSPHAVLEGPVYVGEGTVIEPHTYIKGPVWIGKNCEIRQGAYLRGNVIAGDKCILGNSCEFKNCYLFNEVQVPHFAYVGGFDSRLPHASCFGSHAFKPQAHSRQCEACTQLGDS
jgi:UDP-N-acetylglucosamine diphosphorylase / glucose-1-phosphate thymidylyltransferase / UDP-N-acetylgalactosamine diphosphorylase / glucosamine-1-phosphate N-acetyltransferase / galactosamine-1-phosphate N-acetyltransferase